jgi:hypothetical protein
MAFCAADSLGLQVSSNGVIASTQSPNAEARLDLRTDLVAPLVSSLSNYYQPPSLLEIELLKQRQNQQFQPQTLAQLLGLQNTQLILQQQQQQPQQPAAAAPFLYLGQLTSSDPGESSSSYSNQNDKNQPRRRSDEGDLDQERDTYELYRPNEDEYTDYSDMMPPPEEQEPNYYVMKPRKLKKYSEAHAKKKKQNVRRAAEDLQKEVVFSTNKSNTHNDKFDSLTDSSDDVQESAPASRLDFQMHGN